MRDLHHTLACIAVVCLMSVDACGGSSEIVARVGGEAISKRMLAHRITVLQGKTTGSRAPDGEKALRARALELLISSHWLSGEAARHAISISNEEVHQQVDRIKKTEFVGDAEFREFLRSTGETLADIELQARDELASTGLRRISLDGAPPVTRQRVAAYYVQHKHDFWVPGRREARFVNKKSKAAVEKIKREVEAGKSLTSPVRRLTGEVFAGAQVPPVNEYERAIDDSKPHVVSGPYKIGNDYWLYQVEKIFPARQRTLSEVARSIRRRLEIERRQKAVTAFVNAWRAEWTAKTDCRPGYVVPRCRQYRGPAMREDLFSVQ